MCGLLFTNDPTIERKAFQNALSQLSRRGPDVPDAYENSGHAQLGHARLKILDLDSRSNQPFWSRDKRHAIIFNGEIYNFRKVASEIGYSPTTTSDTEVLLAGYLQEGPRILQRLNGMFAFVIFDSLTGSHFVARDRLGVKPLYYSTSGSKVIYSSEVSAILALTGSSSFDEMAIRQYRAMRGFFNGRTLYSGIKSFPAGHYLHDGKLLKYWSFPEIGAGNAPSDAEVRELLESSVSLFSISDVEYGTYLSGGIDSTIVTALAHPRTTWVVGMKNDNEFRWARLAADHYKTDHQETIVCEQEFLSEARKLVRQRKEPLCVPNEVLLAKLAEKQRHLTKVVLSGEGADELFLGYDRLFRWSHSNKWSIEQFAQLYGYGSKSDLPIFEDVLEPFLSCNSTEEIVRRFFFHGHLQGLLRRLDFATMYHGVEARVPFTDHRLVELLGPAPFHYFFEGGLPKAPLRRIFSDIVPLEITKREKLGFPVDLTAILPESIPGNNFWNKWFNWNLNELGFDVSEWEGKK